MKIARFQFNMFGENTYLVYDPASREAMIVDPGMLTAADRQAVDDFVEEHGLKITHLVNTHLHLDHSFGNAHIERKYGVATKANEADAPLGHDITGQARMFGVAEEFENVGEIQNLQDGDILTLGEGQIRVILTPGHSPGGISLYAPSEGWVITGDTLFGDGNVGRYDLPGGDYRTLMNSVEKLRALPDSTVLLPGHGPASTIGDARAF